MLKYTNRTGQFRKFEQYQDMIARLYPDLNSDTKDNGSGTRVLSRTVTFQVTDACNLACSYCYQINKGIRRMSFETAKKYADLILTGEKNMKSWISPECSPAVIFEFIGGEPFLEIELISDIMDYIYRKMIEMNHPWLTKFMVSICSNGILYFDSRVQKFLNRWRDVMSLSITIDGNKELHDSCRVFPDGRPSYDIAISGAMDWINRGHYMGSKITIAPGNINYVDNAIIHMIELGYQEINANCVYEEGWTVEHAKILYDKMKLIGDYILDHDLEYDLYLSLFNDDLFCPKSESDLDNWCGGTGSMIACDPDGYLYPCIRYMESSLGTDQLPMRIGDIDHGIGCTEQCTNCIKLLNSIDRRSQSTDECFYCPIANGCSWCSGYNYQVFGTPDKRATFICIMHKARALANVYYYNRQFIKHNSPQRMRNYVPDEWALEIISQEELSMLKSLSEINNREDDDNDENRNIE